MAETCKNSDNHPPITIHYPRISVSELAAGELQEDVLEVRVAVEVAQVVAALEILDQRAGIARVAEHGPARLLAAFAARAAGCARPALSNVTVDLDHLRLIASEVVPHLQG